MSVRISELVTGSQPQIDVSFVRKLCASGLGLSPLSTDRYYAWLILLGIFPRAHVEWPERLSSIVSDYRAKVQSHDLRKWHRHRVPAHSTIDYFVKNGYPDTVGNAYLDIIRSAKSLMFLPPRPIDSANPDPSDELFDWAEHVRRLERILTVSTVTCSYYQGFHDLAIMFYCTMVKGRNQKASEFTSKDLNEAEALACCCFQRLIEGTHLLDWFPKKDNMDPLVRALNTFQGLMKKHVPGSGQILLNAHTDPCCYGMRWFTLLFAQDFDLPQLQVTWDVLLAHFEHLTDFVLYVGVAIVGLLYPPLVKSRSNPLKVLCHIELSDDMKIVCLANRFYCRDHPFDGRWVPKEVTQQVVLSSEVCF
jgi:hypothetical protein